VDLQTDLDPTPRPDETPADAAHRVEVAAAEVELRTALARFEQLGDTPPTIRLADNDAQYGPLGAHAVERHGPAIPLQRDPTTRTIEGRIYGDPPWPDVDNWSYRWRDEATMDRTINSLIRENWDRIRGDLAVTEVFSGTFAVEGVVGEGYYNRGMYGTGPRQATYAQTTFVRLRLRLVPNSDPAEMFVMTAFPSGIV
jgi:hypothetical protein